MVKKNELVREYGYLKVGGKYYKFNEGKDYTSYIEVSPIEVKKKISIAKEIAEKLKNSLDREAVLMESLTKLDLTYLEHIHNSLYNSKRTVKPKTRAHHCVDIKVGNLVVPIISD